MTLKTKLISAIVAFVMVASLMMVGILASPTVTMQMGGNVSFTATDLQVTISDGVLANGTLEDSANKMQGVKIDAYDDGAEELATWTNLNLAFNESGEDMTITFTITNNSKVDDIRATVTVEQGTTNNATVSVTTPSSLSATIPANDGSQQFVVTFHVNDRNNPASITGFEIDIDLEKYVPPPYERVDADGNPDPNGSYLLFGYYPQTIIANDVTIVNEEQPESNGYYLGDDDEYYARVSADPYESSYTFSDGSRIASGTEYYFKVEQLKWRILDEDYNGTGNALIVCDTAVDVVPYRTYYTPFGSYFYAREDGIILTDPTATVGQGVDSQYRVYANNYKHSEIREYLNNTFYNTAFNGEEKSYIVTTTVDNSLESTNNNGGQYVCENTFDNVFALSYSEADLLDYMAFYNTDYTLASHACNDTAGTYADTGWAWLRSPYDDRYDGRSACLVIYGGYSNVFVNSDILGVVPALQIQLS